MAIRGSLLDGLIQLRLNIEGEIINANFAVAAVPASDTVIIGMALMDTLRLCLDYDEIGKRIVKIGPEGRIVSSCIKVDHKFVAVRTVAVETHPAIAPLCQAQSLRVMTLHLDSTQYLDGSLVYMEADTTEDGLIVPAQVAEVQHGTIPVQVMNPTNSVQYVDSEIFHLQRCESDEIFPLLPSSTWTPPSDPSSAAVNVDEIAMEDQSESKDSGVIKMPYDGVAGRTRMIEWINKCKAENAPVPEYPGVDFSKSNYTEDEILLIKYGLAEVAHVFARDKNDLGLMKGVEHHIDVEGARPIAQPVRPIPLSKQNAITDEIALMLKAGVIQPSKSPWSSPIVLVKKKDGTWRFCVDYRKVNEVTKKDRFPLPRIDVMLDTLAGGKIFSTFDLNSGYWQIGMEKASQEITAFTCSDGHFEFVKMPFGLCNAPATFQRSMQCNLCGLGKFCSCFIDDICTRSDDFFQHIYDNAVFLKAMDLVDVKISGKKCELFRAFVHFLGHICSAEGIATDPKKLLVVQEAKAPTTEKELRSFLGLTGILSPFLPSLFHHRGPPLRSPTETRR